MQPQTRRARQLLTLSPMWYGSELLAFWNDIVGGGSPYDKHTSLTLRPSAWLTFFRLYTVGGTVATTTHTHSTALCLRLPRWAGTRKVKPIWILWEQETVSGSGISWTICKSVPGPRQITTPAPYHSVVYRPDALPAAQPTASKHWRRHCNSNTNGLQHTFFTCITHLTSSNAKTTWDTITTVLHSSVYRPL